MTERTNNGGGPRRRRRDLTADQVGVLIRHAVSGRNLQVGSARDNLVHASDGRAPFPSTVTIAVPEEVARSLVHPAGSPEAKYDLVYMLIPRELREASGVDEEPVIITPHGLRTRGPS